MSSPQTYTAKDIERYHRGEMTAAEMHGLEKAALDDPFLADALEGYFMAPNAAADLPQVRRRLQQRIEEQKRKKVFIIGNAWLKIAALFVLIAGGGWLVFTTLSGGDENLARSNRPAVERIERPMEADSIASTTDVAQAPALLYDSLQEKEQPVVATATAASPRRRTTPLTPPPAITINDAIAKKEQPVATAPTSVTSGNAAPVEIQTLQDNVAANTRRAAADTLRQNDLAMQQNKVAVEMKTSRMPAAASREQAFVAGTAEPEGGWAGFEKYLAEKKKPGVEKNKMVLEKVVELQFDVDNAGRPVNIKVIESNCDKSCQEEAIRLLKEGPSWKGKTGRVKIPLSP